MELAERVPLPVDRLTELLATLEAQPTATRERILRRFVEAWLSDQRYAQFLAWSLTHNVRDPQLTNGSARRIVVGVP